MCQTVQQMENWEVVLLTTFCATSLFYFVIKSNLSRWKNAGILHEKPSLIWGNMKGFGSRRNVAKILRNVYEKYKDAGVPFVGFYAFMKPMAFIVDLDVTAAILGKDAKYFANHGFYNDVQFDKFSANLLQLDGCAWQNLRKKLDPAFETEYLNCLYCTIGEVAENFLQNVLHLYSDQAIFDVTDMIHSYNAGIMAAIVYGIGGNTFDTHYKFRQMCQEMMKETGFMRLYMALSFPRIASVLGLQRHNRMKTSYFTDILEKKIGEQSDAQSQDRNFLTYFIYMINSDICMDVESVAAQAFSFVFAGYEASYSVLVFCLYELAMQPDIQEKIRKNIQMVLAKKTGGIDIKDIENMQYLEQVFCETLRKYPPYPFLVRSAKVAYEIPQSTYMLNKDDSILIPVVGIHYDPDIYPHPDTFDPDRFEAEAAAARHPMAWIPFGEGPRKCIAHNLARVQILVGIITLLSEFRFETCSQTKIPLLPSTRKLFLSPQSKLYLRLIRDPCR